MRKDTEVSPRGLLLNNQTPTLPDRACLSASLVNAAVLDGSRVAGVGMSPSELCQGYHSISVAFTRTGDSVVHNEDVNCPFIYLQLGRVRPGEGGARRKNTGDLNQRDVSIRARSHLPGDSLVSTPQSGARLQKHTSSTSQHTHTHTTARLKVDCVFVLSVSSVKSLLEPCTPAGL